MRMTEEWKDIPGFEGRYQVSSLGRVKSINRKVNKWNGVKTVPEKILTQRIDRKGYYRIELRDNNGKKHSLQVHRLVAITFIPNPDKKAQVNHISGNKQDNAVSNLEWVSCQENIVHSFEYELRQNIHRVLQYDTNGNLLAIHKNCMDAERKIGIKHRTIQNACTRAKNHFAFDYEWKYERG